MNRGGDTILSVYSDARAEYTKQLCIFLVPAYFQFFIELLEKSKKDMAQEPKRILWQFQTYLNDIHDWNMEKVSQEIHRINANSGCDYLEDLLTAVFIAHTKVLTAIRIGQHHKKIEINIPKVDHFLFKALCESAKLLWGTSYLFRDGIPSFEKQQNYRSIENMLNEGILQAVRTLVPVKSILKDFVRQDSSKEGTTEDEDDTDDESESTPSLSISQSTNSNNTLNTHNTSTSSTQIPPQTTAPSTITTENLLTPLEPITMEAPSDPIPAPTNLTPALPLPLSPVLVPSVSTPQTIILDDKPNVRFGQFDSVFDSDHPHNSDMIYDPKESDTESIHDLEIMDEQGSPLGDGDFDSIDGNLSCPVDVDDYEEIS